MPASGAAFLVETAASDLVMEAEGVPPASMRFLLSHSHLQGAAAHFGGFAARVTGDPFTSGFLAERGSENSARLSEIVELTPTNWNGPGLVFEYAGGILCIQAREACQRGDSERKRSATAVTVLATAQ